MVLVAFFFFLFLLEHSANTSLQETSQETRYLKKLKSTTSIPKKSASCSLRRL
jgi:hypothetical protein